MRGFRIFALLFVSLVILGGAHWPTDGCASSPDYLENYLTFMQSDLAHDPIYAKYSYDIFSERSDYLIDEEIETTRTDGNLAEWQKYFGGAVTKEDLSFLVYKMTPGYLQNLYQQVAARKTQPMTNRLLTVISKPDYLPALEYLIYAKQCEPYVIVSSRWEYELEEELKQRRKPAEMQKMIETGLNKYRKTTNPFLKVRYGYQIVRMAHFSERLLDCVNDYDQLVAGLNVKSVTADWALQHKIGAMQRIGRQAESLVLTSLVFDQNTRMMDEAFLDFYIPPDSIWEQCLKIAANKHRQATLWMMRGLKEERIMLEPLQRMVELEPGSPRNEVMLLRYINVIEREYINLAAFFATSNKEMVENREIALKYLRELKQFIDGVDKTKLRQPALWYTVAGYLSILDHQNQQAVRELDAAAQLHPTGVDLQHQITLLTLLNRVETMSRINETLEADCCDTLQWLDAKAKDAKNNLSNVRDSFYIILGEKYLQAREYAKGYACLAKADMGTNELISIYTETKSIDDLITFMMKPEKSRFETIITTGAKYNVDDLYSFKGTALLRKEKFREAMAQLEKISPDYWEKVKQEWAEWPDAEYGMIRTGFDKASYNLETGLYRYPKGGFPHYTKLEFLRKVLELEDTARRYPEKRAISYYQIANGFFHTPFWADDENYQWNKFWDNMNFLIFNDLAPMQSVIDLSGAGYRQRRVAQAYYLKAMETANDPELAAECCFMAQACMTEFSYYDAYDEPGKGPNYYFRMLREKYSRTLFYQNAVRECAVLKDYVNAQ